MMDMERQASVVSGQPCSEVTVNRGGHLGFCKGLTVMVLSVASSGSCGKEGKASLFASSHVNSSTASCGVACPLGHSPG